MKVNADKFYEAVQVRNPRFDGLFFTGVKTTGIYCRPVCPAKIPMKKNIQFFLSAAEAEHAGFRPCLRCRPETAPGSPVWAGTQSTVSRAVRLIHEDKLNGGGISSLSEKLGVSARHLNRLFNEHVGIGPKSFLNSYRIQIAANLINSTMLAIGDISAIAGFENVRRFNDAFFKVYGFAPSEMRRKKKADVSAGVLTLQLPVRPPFDWVSVLKYLEIRAIPGVEHINGGKYHRTISFDGTSGVLVVSCNQESLCLTVQFPAGFARYTTKILERVRHLFDLRADIDSIKAALRKDPVMRSVLPKGLDVRVPGCWDGFELAVLTIVHQQISLKAGATILGRIASRCGSPLENPEGSLKYLFPHPEQLARADLSNIGMPAKRAASITALAREVAADRISILPSASVNETLAAMKALPGIGDWTVNYIAMRALRDPDCFLETDLGIKKAVEKVGLKERTPARLRNYSEVWAPWKSYATMALWNYLG